ncbi:hypothetical protein SUDANB9_02127 [Streptomyces sp. enrichment culture]
MRVKTSAGSASALLGTSSFLIGAVASPLVGIAGEDTAVPMAVVQLVAAVVALGFLVTLCRVPAARAGEQAGKRSGERAGERSGERVVGRGAGEGEDN